MECCCVQKSQHKWIPGIDDDGSNDDDYAWLQTIPPLDAMESDDTQETGVEAHAFSFF